MFKFVQKFLFTILYINDNNSIYLQNRHLCISHNHIQMNYHYYNKNQVFAEPSIVSSDISPDSSHVLLRICFSDLFLMIYLVTYIIKICNNNVLNKKYNKIIL